MSQAAITERLRAIDNQLASRGFVVKAVDMSADAVTTRLRLQSGLSDMCWRLHQFAPSRDARRPVSR